MKNMLLTNFRRRVFLKASAYSVALSALPQISLAQSNPDVIVIGAGSAGLSATAKLLKNGKSVICIEAMNRIGGRCFTDNSIFGVPYDTGAHWLHSLHGFNGYYNQIAEYGKNNKFNIYDDSYEDDLLYDGNKIDDWSDAWPLLKKINKIKWNTEEDRPFIDFIPESLRNNEWFDTVQKIGTSRDFDNFSPYDANLNWISGGKGDGFVKEGYGTLLAHYRKDVPVKLNTVANEIKWDGKNVKVETNNGTITAKACIVTVSTGVLNSGKIKFTPNLPEKKYEAFDGISMGNYYRITLQLKESFYKKFNINPDNYLYTKVNTKNSKSPKTANGLLRVGGTNISFFNTKGQFAKDLENEGEQASVDFVLNDLRSTFGSDFDKYFIKAHVTDWSSNPYTIGSYAGAKPGKAHLRAFLKRPVGNKIFFAGEATASQFATVHGADRSGERVVESLIKKPEVLKSAK